MDKGKLIHSTSIFLWLTWYLRSAMGLRCKNFLKVLSLLPLQLHVRTHMRDMYMQIENYMYIPSHLMYSESEILISTHTLYMYTCCTYRSVQMYTCTQTMSVFKKYLKLPKLQVLSRCVVCAHTQPMLLIYTNSIQYTVLYSV